MQAQGLAIPLFGSKRRGKIRSQTIGWLSMALVVMAGSTSTPFAKQLTGSFSPISMLFLSEGIAMIFTILSFGCIPLLKEISSIKSKEWPYLLLIGFCNSIVAPIFVFTGIQQTAAVNAELFIRAHTFFLFILSAVLLHETINRTHILAALSILMGITVVALEGFQNGFVPRSGDVFILLGAMMYGFGGIMFKKHLYKLHPEIVILVRGIVALSFIIAISPFLENTFVEEAKNFPLMLLGAAIGYGFISRFLYLFSYYEAMERLPVHTVSLLLPLITVGSLAFSHSYLGEAIEWYHSLGAFLIIVGTLIMHFSGGHFSAKNVELHLKHHQRRHI